MTPARRSPVPLLRQFLHLNGVCIAVGLLLFLMSGKHFWRHMLYAYTIGVQISVYISLLMAGVSRWLLRRGNVNEARRPQLESGWPGWLWMLPCMALGVGAGFVGGQVLGDWLLGIERPYVLAQFSAINLWFSLGLALLISVVTALFFATQEHLHHARMAQEQTRRQASEAQLKLLQSQLEPHMLFNTLAHLRVLIALRPDEAQQMLDQLIAFLRATLQASRTSAHPLAAEFDRLRDYLALMQVRMGARLQVELDLPPELAQRPVPPLLLQPLVENAIKHGLEPAVDGGLLRVSARAHGAGLRLQVEDHGVGLGAAPPSSGTGFGLEQVRERLRTQYGGQARVDLQALQPQGTLVTLDLPT